MPPLLKNMTIVTPLNKSVILNELETWIYIIQATNELRSPVLDFPNYLNILGLVWVCTLIISYFRYILYAYLYAQYKLKELKPIDILTLLHALSDHVSILCLTGYGSLLVLNDKLLHVDTGGSSYCKVLIYTLEFLRGYYFIGGLMMSIYRILLIKRHHWVHGIGQRNLLILLLFLSMLYASIEVSSKASNDYEQLRRDTCLLSFRPNILLVLDEYEQSLGRSSIFHYWNLVQLTSSYGRICIKIVEIMIYVIFFHHLYKNDNRSDLRHLLGSKVIRRRNKENAVTFLTQFCGFLCEMSWTVVYIYTTFIDTKTIGLMTLRFAIRVVTAICIPIIQVVASNALRKRMFKIIFYDIIFGLY